MPLLWRWLGIFVYHYALGRVTVLIVHSQATRESCPHLIGGHGDFVWVIGSFVEATQTRNKAWFNAGAAVVVAINNYTQLGLYA
jgi:nitrite reductase (NO-forming)